MKRVGVLAVVAAVVSCASQPIAWRGASDRDWPVLLHALEAERTARPTQPWAVGVQATMREAGTGRELEARGGLAVAPGRGLRMILVGGPGATALDVWVTPARWRVASPPLGLLRRGAIEAPPDLPVGFLRWWFFGALRGTVFAAANDAGGAAWLLRDGDAVLELHEQRCDRGTLLSVARRAGGRTERVEECRAGAVPAPGDRVHYADERAGLEVDLEVESIATAPPAPEAFDDPDVNGGGP